jgi:hypothetical protein
MGQFSVQLCTLLPLAYGCMAVAAWLLIDRTWARLATPFRPHALHMEVNAGPTPFAEYGPHGQRGPV